MFFPHHMGLAFFKTQDSHFVRVLDDTQREKNRSVDKIQEWRKLFKRKLCLTIKDIFT